MLTGWRLVKRRYADRAFDGEGARLHGGRWNSAGRPVVYVSESRALATLEILTGLRSPAVIPAYVLIKLEFEEGVVTEVEERRLAAEWMASPPGHATQSVGDRWFDAMTSAVLKVPSALVPGEFNFLINPLHPDFRTLKIGSPEQLYLDPRILPP